jgi:peptidoglycan glycosyltransferase
MSSASATSKFVSAKQIPDMSFLLLLQAANTNANAAAANPSLEKRPALLSLVYMGGFALMIIWLIVALIRFRRQRSALGAVAPEDLPDEVRQRLGSTSTNRGLRFLRIFYIVLALAVFGFHVYWARYAAQSNERFQELSYKDLRNRRLSESTLRGWILDRTGKLENALALYRRDGSGSIQRDYQMDSQFAHLFGSDRGDPGLERSLFGIQSTDVPEALQVVMGENIQQRATRDIQLTIHHELQQTAVDQLKGKHGAVVAFNPQTGEVLAMYSNPSYSLKEVQDEARWIQLDADERDKPLVNRALGSYYIPGSTFKTFIMIAAHRAGMQDTDFICSGGGYYALPGAKPIFDDGGAGEVHGQLGIDRAYEVSCNQYFAQMAVKLGPERLKETAKLLGVGAYDTPEDLIAKARRLPEIWNASSDAVKKALAPRESKIVAGPLGRKFNKFDLALEGYGQGYAGQMTPFQMALFAASIGNLEGKLMKPRIEMDRPNEVYNQVTSPQVAARLREIMGLVTGGPEGTARGVFAPVKAAGITSGGKTGTAQKDVPVYDPKTGEPVRKKKFEKDPKGNIIREYEVLVMADKPRIDGWFLCIAPLENPQIAMAVIVEGGGYGSKSAAPIAAQMVLKAKELGLLGGGGGGGGQQKKPNETAQPKKRQPPKAPAQPAQQ